MRKYSAFTLIELIVTMGVIAVVVGPLMLAFYNIQAKQALSAEASNLSGILKQAHIYARESKDESSWGVATINTQQYKLVSRNLSGVSQQAEYRLNHAVAFDTPSFEIWFNQGTGDVKNAASYIVILTTVGALNHTESVKVSPKGVIEI